MVKFKPFLLFSAFPNFKLKLKLGALLLSLSFLFNYQPTLAFPPIKQTLVYAEITQETSVSGENSGVSFQLPHEGYITTTFSAFHPGIDLCTGLGMPIKPIAKGTVSSSGYNFFGLGLVVEVDHGNGYRSLYAHLGKVYVEAGKEVDENSFLGEVGMTGNTSGPHTHIEISKDGVKIDPRLILPEIRNYPKEEDFVAIPAPTLAPQINTAILEEILPQEKTGEIKTDLNQKQIENVLNLATPKPSSPPLPQGGKISLKNFTLFGLKK